MERALGLVEHGNYQKSSPLSAELASALVDEKPGFMSGSRPVTDKIIEAENESSSQLSWAEGDGKLVSAPDLKQVSPKKTNGVSQ